MLVTLCHLPTKNLLIKSTILTIVCEMLVCPWLSLNSIPRQIQCTLVLTEVLKTTSMFFMWVFTPLIPFVWGALSMVMHVSLSASLTQVLLQMSPPRWGLPSPVVSTLLPFSTYFTKNLPLTNMMYIYLFTYSLHINRNNTKCCKT